MILAFRNEPNSQFRKVLMRMIFLKHNSLMQCCPRFLPGSNNNTNLPHKSISYSILDEKFYVDCFEYLEILPSGLLVRNPIPFTNEKDIRIPLPEKFWNRVLASFHGKNHAGGNSLADCVQLKYIFPRLVSFCREYVFKCPRCQKLSNKKAQ